MSPNEQVHFFAGAARAGLLAEAFWRVSTDADAMRGDHEQYVKLAFNRAMEAARADLRKALEAISDLEPGSRGAYAKFMQAKELAGKALLEPRS